MIFTYLYFLFSLTAASSIKQLHIVFRHGERAPTETYKTDPYNNITWSGGWGQLTNRGKLEMYSLGLKLREWYQDFIPEFYYPEDVKMTSSYADRCLMSAETLLAGLFPPKDGQIWKEGFLWQPIPVHYLPRSQDKLIAMRAPCKKYDEVLKEVQTSGEVKKIEEQNAELFKYLTLHTGQAMDTIGKVELFYNTLEIEILHNLTLPSWLKDVSMDHLKTLAARNLESFVETDYMKRMKGGTFLKHAISAMKSESHLLFLYSAHDITLVNILKTLGYTKMLKPGFGASFVMEMRNNSEILMKYRDSVDSSAETISLQECGTLCTLDNYEKALEHFLPLDWDKECHQ